MAAGADTARRRGVLHVIHGHGGGTEHHARALIDASRTRFRHFLAIAVGDTWRIEEHRGDGTSRAIDRRRGDNEGWPEFFGNLCTEFGIDLVHLHNITACRDGIIAALQALPVPYGYTVHDLNYACPTILFLGADGNYCHEVTDPAICSACLAVQPPFAQVDIADWRLRHRALLAHSAFLIGPSRWAAAALARYFPDRAVAIVPHAAPGVWALRTAEVDIASTPPSRALALPDDGIPTVAVLGAVGPDKGARRLERLAALVRANGTQLRFVLVGYMDVEHGPWQSGDRVLTIHGRYDPRDLPGLLAHYRVRLVAFPSAGPETFSFTLSEAWSAGLPVIVPPFGALGERVADTGAGWLWTDAEWRDEAKMLARIVALMAAENADALAGAAAVARAVPQITMDDMAGSTIAIYEGAIQASVSTTASSPVDASARNALPSHRTLIGRVLARLAPLRRRNARPR